MDIHLVALQHHYVFFYFAVCVFYTYISINNLCCSVFFSVLTVLFLILLEIRSVECGICLIAKSTMTELFL